VDKNLFVSGSNIFALRIVGDPTYACTGLYYTMPYYIDDYRYILSQHQNYFRYFFSGIFAFTAIYYLLIFISIRKREELYNLYYSIFSTGLSVHYFLQDGTANYFIPNSDIAIRLEYAALFITMSTLLIFIEQMGRQKVSKVSWVFLGIALYFSVTQVFFCTQYGDEVLQILLTIWLLYFPFVLFGIIRHHFLQRRKDKLLDTEKSDDIFFSLLIGSIIIYACGIHDALDIIIFRNYFRIVHYSTLVFHIGMALILSSRFRGMYKQLEQSNIILEAAYL
jgi:adenylate cyclase